MKRNCIICGNFSECEIGDVCNACLQSSWPPKMKEAHEYWKKRDGKPWNE